MADERLTHPMMTHRDGSQCIWVDGGWFVPLDVGGEGYPCPQEHPMTDVLARVQEVVDAVAEDTSMTLAPGWMVRDAIVAKIERALKEKGDGRG